MSTLILIAEAPTRGWIIWDWFRAQEPWIQALIGIGVLLLTLAYFGKHQGGVVVNCPVLRPIRCFRDNSPDRQHPAAGHHDLVNRCLTGGGGSRGVVSPVPAHESPPLRCSFSSKAFVLVLPFSRP